MPRVELRWRPAALEDLDAIFRAVLRVSASPIVARRYVAQTQHSCHQTQSSGRPRIVRRRAVVAALRGQPT
jgi:plasmid stabilization system protein ParE